MQSLTEYKKKCISNKELLPLEETYLFSENECVKISNILIQNEHKWQARVGNCFFSFGALSYLDEGWDYQNKLQYFNPLLWENFDWVYKKIQNYYQEKLNKSVVYWNKEPFPKAFPGFHIFQNSEIINQNKWGASIHTDSPHTKHAWPTKINCVFTFTISIQSPNNGSGLRFWLNEENFHNISPVYYDDLIEDDKRKLEEEAIYIPYKIGYIYEHDGNTYHQIATEKDFKPNERRISLQGHLTELNDCVILYV